MRLPAAMLQSIAEHMRAGAPNEACGLVVGSAPWSAGGVPVRFEPCRNRDASPTRFEIHPDDVARVLLGADRAGLALWAIVHSHVRTAAVPSETDISRATWWPGSLWIVVSLAPAEADPVTGAPSIRSWSIEGGAALELPVAAS